MGAEFVHIEGLRGVLKTLQQLPPEIVSKRGGPVRRALRKSSKIMVEAMKANVQAIIDEPNIGGIDKSTGLLLKNIITARKSNMQARGERYGVGPRLRKKYPKHSSDEKTRTVIQIGRLLETGTERRRAMPWARPAFDANKGKVIPIFVHELNADIGRIVKKLASQNGVA